MSFLAKLKLLLTDEVLRRRIFFTLAILVLFRLGANIPVPFVDGEALAKYFSDSSFLGLLNLFSGGGLSSMSIMMLGVGPYITATIILQLLTMVFPKLKALYHEEGERGRKRFAQYGRLLTVPLCLIQSYSLIVLLRNQGIFTDTSSFALLVSVIVVMGASMLLMWMGELINEFGVGNGVSLLIFAGIVDRIPVALSQLFISFDVASVPLYAAFIVVALIIIAGVVYITEAERPIPVTYAKRIRGMKVYGGSSTYIPLRVNQAGVMPIIFALALLLFPQIMGTFLMTFDNSILKSIGSFIDAAIRNLAVYGSLYFILVFLFTYFYTAVTFDPDTMANNLQKSGAFIPGVRPGPSTAQYVSNVLVRLTLVGALFLGIIAVLPIGMQAVTNMSALTVGGTGLLIVVSVILELIKQLNAQLSMREY